jgi:hypothetical protein
MSKNAEWEHNTYSCQRELKKKYETLSGFEVKPLYTPADVEGLDYPTDLGYPGDGPAR